MIDRLIICLDMHGCPNRCKHCFLPHQKNPSLKKEDLERVAEAFKPFAKHFGITGWTREVDYSNHYAALRERECILSDETLIPRPELLSFWRIKRDEKYLPWAKAQGIRKLQLTFFGDEAMTDHYVGRAGAYKELIYATEQAIRHDIVPRWQIFLNQETLKHLPYLEQVIDTLKLETRLKAKGQTFECFVHQGSCEGNNRAQYNIWLEQGDLEQIPAYFIHKTKAHFKTNDLDAVFGLPEETLIAQYASDHRYVDIIPPHPIIYIDGNFDCYLHMTAYARHTFLGNLDKEGPEYILNRYSARDVPLLEAARTVTKAELTRFASPTKKLFLPEDWFMRLLHVYCDIAST